MILLEIHLEFILSNVEDEPEYVQKKRCLRYAGTIYRRISLFAMPLMHSQAFASKVYLQGSVLYFPVSKSSNTQKPTALTSKDLRKVYP